MITTATKTTVTQTTRAPAISFFIFTFILTVGESKTALRACLGSSAARELKIASHCGWRWRMNHPCCLGSVYCVVPCKRPARAESPHTGHLHFQTCRCRPDLGRTPRGRGCGKLNSLSLYLCLRKARHNGSRSLHRPQAHVRARIQR